MHENFTLRNEQTYPTVQTVTDNTITHKHALSLTSLLISEQCVLHLIICMYVCSQAATQLLCIQNVTLLRFVICFCLSYIILSACDLITFYSNCHGNKPCYANMRLWFRQVITGLLVYCNNAVI